MREVMYSIKVMIALPKAQVIAILKFNQQEEDDDRTLVII